MALFLPKSIIQLQALCGVLLSGNVYMPLDIKSPLQRLEAILAHIKPVYVITDKEHQDKLINLVEKEKILLIEDLIKEIEDIKTNFSARIDTDPAYIINTSGSTGVPKGVVVSHRSVIDYIEWILSTQAICPRVDDVIGNQSPFYFDKSLFDIYPTFAIGNKLVLIPEEKFIFPTEALKFLIQKQINYIYWVPSIFNHIAHYDLLKDCAPKLDRIFFGGEAMSAKVLNYLKSHYPLTTFGNLYGPSEITDICAYYMIQRDFQDTEPIPIGYPCRNAQIILIDTQGNKVSTPNTIGEIYIRGSCLALGYYNDFDKTQTAFIQNPLHQSYIDTVYKTGDLSYYNQLGELILTGRKDHQIKHNGYRIELGEIEIALRDFQDIKHHCVIYTQGQIILCYEGLKEIEKAEFLAHLKGKIAKYMMPQRFLYFQKLPINANGKIDRLSLQEFANSLLASK
nr:AMP-binding protein [Helicobacter sp. 12S02634-8]